MRHTHDVAADAMYIYISDAPIDHTEELSDGTIVDVGADGRLVGVEILAASSGWDSAALARRFELPDRDLETIGRIVREPAKAWGAASASELPGAPILKSAPSTNIASAHMASA